MRKDNKKTSKTCGAQSGANKSVQRRAKDGRGSRFIPKGEGEYEVTDKGRNDPNWYLANPQYAQYVGGLGWNQQLGLTVDLNNAWLSNNLPISKGLFKVPGVCAFRIIPQFGRSSGANSPINVAAQKMYTELRRQISGSRNYDAADLMLYCLAVGDVYSYITFLQRCIGIANLYEQVNRYMPDALLRAMKVNPESLRRDLANFVVRVNALIDKVATFKVPSVFPLFSRRAFMYQNVYKESESLRDQMYIYTPQGFYQFGLDSSGATALNYKAFQATVGTEEQEFTADNLITYGEELFSAMWYNEDAGTMSGDVARAFEGRLIELAYVPQNYQIEPIWNIGVLEQMKNATVVPNFIAQNLVQDSTKAYLLIEPKAQTSQATTGMTWEQNASGSITTAVLAEDRLLTTTTINVNPELVIESTRLMVAADNFLAVESGGYKTWSVQLHPGSEVVISALFYTYAVAGTTPDQLIIDELHYSTMITAGDAEKELSSIRTIGRESNFRFKPAQHFVPARQGSVGTQYQIGDGLFYYNLDNYTVVPTQTLKNLHEVALLSMLDVPRR